MKKLVFGLIATVVFGGLCYGQKNDPSNPKNEFDYVGKIHNEALEKIMNSKTEKELFVNNPKKYCINLLKNNKIETAGFISAMEDKNVIDKLGKFDNNIPIVLEEQIPLWYENKYINENVKEYLIKLNLITEKYYTDLNYVTFKKDIILLEEKAYSLNNNDKVIILSTASLTRFTVSYWSNNASSLNRYTGTGRGLGLADIGGAVAGAVRTYVACFFTGPVGWGAWAGAVIGTGLGASAMYVIVNH
jgi:hypothetical protein